MILRLACSGLFTCSIVQFMLCFPMTLITPLSPHYRAEKTEVLSDDLLQVRHSDHIILLYRCFVCLFWSYCYKRFYIEFFSRINMYADWICACMWWLIRQFVWVGGWACAPLQRCLCVHQVEKRLDLVKQVSHSTHKKLTACLQGQQGADVDKRSVKSPTVCCFDM